MTLTHGDCVVVAWFSNGKLDKQTDTREAYNETQDTHGEWTLAQWISYVCLFENRITLHISSCHTTSNPQEHKDTHIYIWAWIHINPSSFIWGWRNKNFSSPFHHSGHPASYRINMHILTLAATFRPLCFGLCIIRDATVVIEESICQYGPRRSVSIRGYVFL